MRQWVIRALLDQLVEMLREVWPKPPQCHWILISQKKKPDLHETVVWKMPMAMLTTQGIFLLATIKCNSSQDFVKLACLTRAFGHIVLPKWPEAERHLEVWMLWLQTCDWNSVVPISESVASSLKMGMFQWWYVYRGRDLEVNIGFWSADFMVKKGFWRQCVESDDTTNVFDWSSWWWNLLTLIWVTCVER